MVKGIPELAVYAEALQFIENADKEWSGAGNELIRDILEKGALKLGYEMARLASDGAKRKGSVKNKDNSTEKLSKHNSDGNNGE